MPLPLALAPQCTIFVEEPPKLFLNSACHPIDCGLAGHIEPGAVSADAFGSKTLGGFASPPRIVPADEGCHPLPTQLARDL
jgi:hypothetical protein